MEIAGRDINIKIHHVFSKQRILGVSVSIVKRKSLGDLTRTCF